MEVLLSAASLVICVFGSRVWALMDSLTAEVLSCLYEGSEEPTQAPWLAQTS